MPRPEGKDERTFITVHDGMPEHGKIEGLSDAAFRQLIELWCLCSRTKNDGLLSEASWRKRGTPRTRKELMDAGLAEVADGGIQMHDYLKHQRSAAEIAEIQETKRAAGKKGAGIGNHKRHHVDKGVFNPECEWCADTSAEPSAPARHVPTETLGTTSAQVSANGSAKRRTETETESLRTSVGREGESSVPREDRTPPPNHCSKHPGGTTDPCGPCGAAKRQRADFEAEQARVTKLLTSEAAHRDAQLRRAAIEHCGLCDDDGRRQPERTAVCDHVQRQPGALARARAAVQNQEQSA